MKAKHRGLVAALLITGSGFVPAMAAAPSAVEDFTIRIAYDDLNIDSASGAKALYDRMQQASARACGWGSYRELRSLYGYRMAQTCYDTALDKLVAGVDSEPLRQLHASS